MSRTTPSRDHGQSVFLILLGALGLAGCIALIVGCIVAAAYVPNYNWMSDTISDLAAGENELIMDIALYGFAAGLIATAIAGAHLHLGRKSWSAGVLALAVLSALVVIVGARNEYGDNDSDGVVIHMYLVYGIGILFLVVAFGMAYDITDAYKRTKWSLIVAGIAWGIMAPVFLLVPTNIDGLFERILGLVACAIVSILSVLFIRHGQRSL